MRYALHIAWFTMIACGTADERAAEHALRAGEIPYRANRATEAADIYATASFNPHVAFNLGDALYLQALWDSAATTFDAAAASTTDPMDQAAAFHNLGNSRMQLALRADSTERDLRQALNTIRIEGKDVALKVRRIVQRDSLLSAIAGLEGTIDSTLTLATDAYKNALRRAPGDEDARHDLAMAQRMQAARKKEVTERSRKDPNKKKDDQAGLSESAQAIMQQADALVEKYEFVAAMELLRKGLVAHPTLQQRQDYMNKLNVVTQAAKAK